MSLPSVSVVVEETSGSDRGPAPGGSDRQKAQAQSAAVTGVFGIDQVAMADQPARLA